MNVCTASQSPRTEEGIAKHQRLIIQPGSLIKAGTVAGAFRDYLAKEKDTPDTHHHIERVQARLKGLAR